MKNKMHSKQTIVSGFNYKFPSKLEARRYEQLILLERAGEIRNLKLQPEYVLSSGYVDPNTGEKMRQVIYIGDFEYIENGKLVLEEIKGFETDVFRMKWRLVKEKYPHVEFRMLKQGDF
jgi:hypothetical protein